MTSTEERITINGTEYIRADNIPAGPPTETRIVVADRGWVFVGQCANEEDGAITISNAQVIRRWGTDEKRPGLGYLAQHGPTDKTVLEPSGVVRVPLNSIVATFDSDAERWA